MSDTLYRWARRVFLIAAPVFFVGLPATMVVSILAFVMPSWWQFVWLAFVCPTLASLPIWMVAALVAMLSKPSTTRPTP